MSTLVEQIDALLPQTQCGLCGYKGCLPYAEALALEQAAINLCPPGGVPGMLAIAELLAIDPTSYQAEIEKNAKPPLQAVIREAECIGCTKCIQACPVDAILGSNKQMHTVIANECTGCELCVAPCPVDCIDMIKVDTPVIDKKNQYRSRYHAREKRLQQLSAPKVKPKTSAIIEKKDYIKLAIERAQAKKSKR